MPDANDIKRWTETIRRRYENYLKTSFYFKDPILQLTDEWDGYSVAYAVLLWRSGDFGCA